MWVTQICPVYSRPSLFINIFFSIISVGAKALSDCKNVDMILAFISCTWHYMSYIFIDLKIYESQLSKKLWSFNQIGYLQECLALWVKFSADDILKYIFFLFFPENRIRHFMQIVSETICMKSQILFSGKNKKNITNLLSAELAQRVVKVKSHPWDQIC